MKTTIVNATPNRTFGDLSVGQMFSAEGEDWLAIRVVPNSDGDNAVIISPSSNNGLPAGSLTNFLERTKVKLAVELVAYVE